MAGTPSAGSAQVSLLGTSSERRRSKDTVPLAGLEPLSMNAFFARKAAAATASATRRAMAAADSGLWRRETDNVHGFSQVLQSPRLGVAHLQRQLACCQLAHELCLSSQGCVNMTKPQQSMTQLQAPLTTQL